MEETGFLAKTKPDLHGKVKYESNDWIVDELATAKGGLRMATKVVAKKNVSEKEE